MTTSTPLPLVLAVYDRQNNWLGNFRCCSVFDVEQYLERQGFNLPGLQPLMTRTLVNLNEVISVIPPAACKSTQDTALDWDCPIVHIGELTEPPRQQCISVNFNGLLAMVELAQQLILYALGGERTLCQEVFLNTGDWYELVLHLVDDAEEMARLAPPSVLNEGTS